MIETSGERPMAPAMSTISRWRGSRRSMRATASACRHSPKSSRWSAMPRFWTSRSKRSASSAWCWTCLLNNPTVTWVISSFAWDTLRTVRRLDPVAEVWPLAEHVCDDLIAIAAELASPTVSLFTGAYTAETAARLHDAGLRAVVWTVNDPREARRVADLGAFALCTDDPQHISRSRGII